MSPRFPGPDDGAAFDVGGVFSRSVRVSRGVAGFRGAGGR